MKKIETIKQNFREMVENGSTFYGMFPNYPISDISTIKNPKKNEEYLMSLVSNIGSFIDSINDDFERAVIATIIFINGIELTNYCSYCLPSTEDILKSMPLVIDSINRRSLKIKIYERINEPFTKDTKHGMLKTIHKYSNLICIEDFDAYGIHSPLYRVDFEWYLPVFK